jgi:uncharacterized protein YfaP (DUF2135 family)
LITSFCVGHDFIGYLDNYESEIYAIMSAAYSTMVQPEGIVSTGVITIRLTWDSQPDLDLHVFEPTSHVYYRNKQGQAGYLDVDDTNGYGPEHYYAKCQKLEVGSYKVAVNYYSGLGTSSAEVDVRAGGQRYYK